jgi:uncharacterized protein YaiL (DUF2058 family)
MPVNALLRERLVRGELVIVRCDGHYDLVPAAEAPRIRERDPNAVVHAIDPSAPAGSAPSAARDGDPYKDYVVPDDLTW